MAAWNNGKTQRIYVITSYGMNTQDMLSDFWFDLLNQNKGRSIDFHNWAGYDSILSLKSLVNLRDLTFEPVLNNNEVISVRVKLIIRLNALLLILSSYYLRAWLV